MLPPPRIAARGGTSRGVRIPSRCVRPSGVNRSDTASRAKRKAVNALQPYCLHLTSEASPSETAPLQRLKTCESRRQFAMSAATLMGFGASLARVMIVSQVPVSIRPRHLQGLLYTLLAASSLTTLPVKAGALLRFTLQRFPPPPVSPPSPGRGPLAVGASGLLDFRAVAGRGPLEPRLPDPLLGFTPPGPSIPTPATNSLEPRSLLVLRWPRPRREDTHCTSRAVLRRDPLSSLEAAFPPGVFDLVLFSVSLGGTNPGIIAFPQPFPLHKGGFRHLWGRVRPTGVQQGRDFGRANMS